MATVSINYEVVVYFKRIIVPNYLQECKCTKERRILAVLKYILDRSVIKEKKRKPSEKTKLSNLSLLYSLTIVETVSINQGWKIFESRQWAAKIRQGHLKIKKYFLIPRIVLFSPFFCIRQQVISHSIKYFTESNKTLKISKWKKLYYVIYSADYDKKNFQPYKKSQSFLR